MAPPRDNHPPSIRHPATYRFECSKAFYNEVWHQLAISSSSARHQLVISSSSVRHQLVISSSSEKKGKREIEKERKREKEKKRIREKDRKRKKGKTRKSAHHPLIISLLWLRPRPTLEMASEGPQRITGKYYGVYLPSYTIYPFAINLSICHTICNLSTVLIHLWWSC